MPDLRQDFIFPDASSPMNYEARKAHALEFIAHYLDRIDGHLERLAGVASNQVVATDKIVLEMRGMAHLLARK